MVKHIVRRGYVAKGSRFAPRIGAAIRAGRSLYNAYKSYSSSGSKQRSIEVAPVTSQKDVRTVYRKRRMPRRKKRRYVKNIRRFRTNMLKSLPARIFSYVQCDQYSSAVDYSVYFDALMGLCNNTAYDLQLQKIFDEIGPGASNKTQGGSIRIDHMSLGVVLENKGDNEVDVDVYKVMCVRDCNFTVWAQSALLPTFMVNRKNLMREAGGMDIEVDDAGLGITTTQQSAGNTVTTQAVGDMLWNNPPFLRYFKVLQQQKIHLPAGGTCQFQMRSSKNRMLARDVCLNNSAKAYLTQGYIFNINGRWSFGGGFAASTVTIERYVRYNIKVVPGQSPTLVYDPTS